MKSIRISVEFTRDPRVSPAARAVFLSIAAHEDSRLRERGPSSPSYEDIMADTGIGSHATISRAIKELVALGYLFKTPLGQRVEYWRVPEEGRLRITH
jgi:hypothetical protein